MTTIKISASIVVDNYGSNDQPWIEVRSADANQFTGPTEEQLLEATELAIHTLQLPAEARTSSDESVVLVEPYEENDEGLLGQSLEYICDALNHGIEVATDNAVAAAELAERDEVAAK